MSGDMSSPVARRLRRPSWRDPRLGLGVFLVAGSVALGTWAISDADRGVALYATRGVLTPGDAVSATDLTVIDARIAGADGVYLRADEPVADGAVVTRLIGPGELVPVGAIGTGADVDVRPIGVPVSGPLGSAIVKGAVVDLWLTVPAGSGVGGTAVTPVAPRLVAGGLLVAEVSANEDMFAASEGTSVQVLVPSADLPSVLAAVAGDGEITLVPLPGGA